MKITRKEYIIWRTKIFNDLKSIHPDWSTEFINDYIDVAEIGLHIIIKE